MDKIKKQQPQTMTKEEEDTIRSNAEAAQSLLESPEFKFFRDKLVYEKEQIITNAVNNKLKKIVVKKEGHDVIYERWEQEAEEAGRFKFLFELASWLESVKNMWKEHEDAKQKGLLVIEN